MIILRFVRKDGKPNEEYYYNEIKYAEEHLECFFGDDSNLYSKIELIKLVGENEKIISYIKF